MSDIEDCKRICSKIGIETVTELEYFCKKERQGNESRIETLRRYEKEFDEAGVFMENKIEKLLLEKDFKPNLKGFDYIVEAIELIQQDKTYSRAITTRLYPKIAKNNNDTFSNVEMAIRQSIKSAKIGNTNAEFLARIIIELKEA